MQRITGDDVAEDLFGAGKDGFTDGSPGIEAATVVTDKWLNEVQEELLSVIEGAGLAPSTSAQLRAAIMATQWNFTYPQGISAHYVKANVAFLYSNNGIPSAPGRTVMLPLSSAGNAGGWNSAGGGLISLAANAPIEIPLPIQSECVVTRVRVAYQNSGAPGSAPSFSVIRKVADKSAPPGIGTLHVERSDTDAGGTAGNTGTVAQTMSTGTFSSTPAALVTEEWYVRITGSSNPSGDLLYWVEASFTDPGPRNY